MPRRRLAKREPDASKKSDRTRSSGDLGMVDQTDLRRSACGARGSGLERSLKKLLLKPRKCHYNQRRLRGLEREPSRAYSE
jgi:hypothetical protein